MDKIFEKLKLTRPLTDEEVTLFMSSVSPEVREAAEKLHELKQKQAGSIALPRSGTCPAAWPVRVGDRCFTRAAAENLKQSEEDLTKHFVDVKGAVVMVSEVKDLIEIGKDLAEEDLEKRGFPVPDPEGGVHGHGLIRRENKTLEDGPHLHLLITDEGIFISQEDGFHPHKVPRGKSRTTKGGAHKHEFVIVKQSFFTDEDGEHDHDLLVFTSAFDGTHQHKIKINGKVFTTISSAEFVKLHPEAEQHPPIEVGTATEIMKMFQLKKEDYDAEVELTKHLDLIEEDFQRSWDEADEWIMKVFIQKQTEVQSVVLSKTRFKTLAEARQWVKEHDFKTTKVDETTNTFRFRQFSPGRCREGTFRNKRITDGVLAVICIPKSQDLPPEGFGKSDKEEIVQKVQSMMEDFSQDIRKAMYKWFDLPYNPSRFMDSSAGFQISRVVKVIVVEKTPCDSCGSENAFNYLAAIGPVSKQELKNYKQTVVIGDQGYVILGKTSGSDVEAEVGDIVEVKVSKLVVDRKQKKHGFDWSDAEVIKTTELKVPDSISKVISLATPFEKMYRESLQKKIKIFPDGDQHFILGIMLEPETVDKQNEIYSAEEIEAAAHHYLEAHRNVGYMHKELINDKVKLVESYVTRADMVIGGQKVKKGTWIVGLLVLDHEIWKQIKSRELTGLSIGGSAIRVPV